MSGHHAVAYIGLALSAVAGIAAIAGWGLNRPNNSKRYQWRFLAWGLGFAVMVWWGVADDGWRRWADFACALIAYARAADWWRRLELVRTAERGQPLSAEQLAYVQKLIAKRNRYKRWSS